MDELQRIDKSALGRYVREQLALRREGKIRPDGSPAEPTVKSTGGSVVDKGESIFRSLIPGCDRAEVEAERVVKDAEPDDDTTMDPDEKKRRGVAAVKRVSFADVIAPAMRTFPIEDQPERSGPRAADEGLDPDDREYSDAVLERLGGGTGGHRSDDPDPVPRAGAGEPWVGDSRDVPDSDARFMPRGEGDAGRLGGEDRGGRLAGPMQQYVNESGPVRVGDFAVMNPGNSGIMPAADFIKPEPRDGRRRVLKDERLGRGLFTSAILGAKGDQADGGPAGA